MATIVIAGAIGGALGAAIFPVTGDILTIPVGAGIGITLGLMTYKGS